VRYGDLSDRPFRDVLEALAARSTTGCLRVGDAKVFLHDGEVCAVTLPGRRPQLGDRLISSAALGPDALAEALDAQRDAGPTAELGELLIRSGYVDQPLIEAFVTEQILDGCSELLCRTAGRWDLTDDEPAPTGLADALPVPDLLTQVLQRDRAWVRLAELVPGPAARPALSTAGLSAAPVEVSGEAWAVLCKVDDRRSVRELAAGCGFTMFEATYVVAKLVHSGLLEITEPASAEPSVAGAWPDNAEQLGAAEPLAAAEPFAAAEPLVKPASWPSPAESLSASALLSKLWREHAPLAAAVSELVDEPAPLSQPADVPAPPADNDTASLMRELSFLGVDEQRSNRPSAAPPSPRPSAMAGQKKRKGLFGR